MSKEISKIEGVGDEYTKKLNFAGIKTAEELLAVGASAEGRQDISARSGIPIGFIENWVAMADLTRVEGVGFQFAELLTFSGVNSVRDLRKRNPEFLHRKLTQTNKEKNFTQVVPSPETLDKFIESARSTTNILL